MARNHRASRRPRLLVVCVALLVLAATAALVVSRMSVDTSVPTRLAWFYKPPAPSDEAVVLAGSDSFVLTKGDEEFQAKVRAAKPEAQVLQYFLLNQIVKPDEGGVEWRNNAAYEPGDFDRLRNDHPDWFLRDAAGDPVVEGGRYYRMDPGNAAWRAFWVERVLAANTGWDGVFADNLDVSLCAYDKNGVSFPAYPTDEAYTDALLGFVEYAHGRITAGAGKPLEANLVGSCAGRDLRERYYPYLDGAMVEAWGVDWDGGYLDPAEWQEQLASVDRFVGDADRRMILVSQGKTGDTDRRRFAFASYLLVSGPTVAWRYADAEAYDVPLLEDDVAVQLGSPTGPRVVQDDGSVRRDFTHGSVVVNPVTHASSIEVG